MKLRFVRIVSRPATALLFLIGPLFAPAMRADVISPYVESGEWDFKSEASDLLKEIQSRSIQLQRNASELEAFRMAPQLSWQTHAHQLTLVRDHVNAIGGKLERLQQIRHLAELWQQQAIYRLMPIGANLASRTEAAIAHLNEHRGYLFAPDYNGHLASISDHADQIREWVDTFVELPKVQQHLERLEAKIAETKA